MRRRQKIILGIIVISVVTTVLSHMWMKRNTLDITEDTYEEQSERAVSSVTSTQTQSEINVDQMPEKSKYEKSSTNEISVDFTYLDNFLGAGKQFILQMQLQQLLGDEINSARCLEYQKIDQEGTQTEFYILLNTGQIVKVLYSFRSDRFTTELTQLQEQDVWEMKEAEERALESESQAQQETELQENET